MFGWIVRIEDLDVAVVKWKENLEMAFCNEGRGQDPRRAQMPK